MLSEFANNLFLSGKKRYLVKIIGVGNHYLIPIDEQKMEVLLQVQRTDIVNYLSCTGEKLLHFSAVGFYNIN